MWNIKISFGYNNDKKIGVGEFTAESYMTIDETLSSLAEDFCERHNIKDPDSLNVTFDLKYTEDTDIDEY